MADLLQVSELALEVDGAVDGRGTIGVSLPVIEKCCLTKAEECTEMARRWGRWLKNLDDAVYVTVIDPLNVSTP